MAFHPYPHLIQRFFNISWFGPPRHLTAASSWTWVDHSASRLPQVTNIALLRLAFASGTSLRDLALLPTSNSLAHYAKGTLSPDTSIRLQLIVGIRFQVLFHSPPGVLFTFPSRYSSLSVTDSYLALEDGPPRFNRDSSCPGLLGCLTSLRTRISPTGLSPPPVRRSRRVPLSFPQSNVRPHNPAWTQAHTVWAPPRSLAAT